MIGAKFYKENLDLNAYSAAAEWCNNNNATIEDKGEYYEVVSVPEPTQEERDAAEIERLKAELAATDYKVLKWIDGALSEDEYNAAKSYRAELRARINELGG